jgi:sugar fermentation stimulation protein A
LKNGVYIAVFHLGKPLKINVGKLGRACFRKGTYLYVGSAQRNLQARLQRHGEKKKALRWHVDYLSSRAQMIGAVAFAGPHEYECELAKKLGGMFESVVPGFGASDCRCGGHLFYAAEPPEDVESTLRRACCGQTKT